MLIYLAYLLPIVSGAADAAQRVTINRGEAEPLHTIEQGVNVAAACALAFESAHQVGWWLEVPF